MFSVAKKFEEKVAKFQKNPKQLEKTKYLYQIFKIQKYLHLNRKSISQTSFKQVSCLSFISNKKGKVAKKGKVYKFNFWSQNWVKSSQIGIKSPKMAPL